MSRLSDPIGSAAWCEISRNGVDFVLSIYFSLLMLSTINDWWLVWWEGVCVHMYVQCRRRRALLIEVLLYINHYITWPFLYKQVMHVRAIIS